MTSRASRHVLDALTGGTHFVDVHGHSVVVERDERQGWFLEAPSEEDYLDDDIVLLLNAQGVGGESEIAFEVYDDDE